MRDWVVFKDPYNPNKLSTNDPNKSKVKFNIEIIFKSSPGYQAQEKSSLSSKLERLGLSGILYHQGKSGYLGRRFIRRSKY